MGKEYVGIDLHRRRSLIYRMDQAGEKIDSVRSTTNRAISPRR